MSQLDLRQTQAWMMALLTAPDGLTGGLQKASQIVPAELEKIIAHDTGADRLTRLSVYTNSYLLRLIQCLEADFPALLNLMGAELFRFFASSYIRHHPSNSTTLYDLGQGFADFLQHTQAACGENQEAGLILPIELARLERKRTEVTRAKGLEELDAPGYLDPMVHLFTPGTVINTPACLRLLELSYPLIDFIKSIDLGETSPQVPARQTSYVAITRMHYRVSMHYLEDWQFHFLQAAKSPSPINTSVQNAADHTAMDKQAVSEELIFWLPIAAENGMVQLYDVAQK